MCAAAKKAVKVGVDKDAWHAIKAISGKRGIARNVEKAMQMYLDIMKGEAVIIKCGEKYSVVNAFNLNLDLEKISNCDVFPIGGEFSEKVLTHLLSLALPKAIDASCRVEEVREGCRIDYPRPIPQHEMKAEILARKLVKGDVQEVALSFWKGDPPDFREDFAVFRKDRIHLIFMSRTIPYNS